MVTPPLALLIVNLLVICGELRRSWTTMGSMPLDRSDAGAVYVSAT
jgi:hypothetical protein